MELALALFAIAFSAGFVGALLGVGGGIIVVPALTLLLDVPIHMAIGSSITGVIATSSAATLAYLRSGFINVRLGMLLEVPTVVGAVLGGLTAVMLPGHTLQGIFAGILVYAAVVMARPGRAGTTVREQPMPGGWMTESFIEPTTGAETAYTPRRASIGLSISVVAGAVSGMLGVGGGIIKIPLMITVMSVPVRPAMATSAFMIGLTGAASAFIYYSHGFVAPHIAGPTAIGILVGARVGSVVARVIKPRTLALLFIVLLLFSAARMALEAFR